MLAKGSGYAEAGAAEGEHARHYPHVFADNREFVINPEKDYQAKNS